MIKNLKYMNLDYSEKDLQYIDSISSEIESISKEIVDFFELKEYGNKPIIKIFDNLDEFRNYYENIFKRKPRNGVCGFAKNNNVYTLSLSEYKKCEYHENSNIDDLIKLILHEFTHIIHLKRNNKATNIFLLEGAATYLSGQYKDIKDMKGTYEDLILGKCVYSDYKLAFEHILNKYGREYILKLIDKDDLLNENILKEIF